MSRVSFDATLGWVPRESLAGQDLWDLVPQAGSFDEHLQQARTTAASATYDNGRAETETASQAPRSPEDRRPMKPADPPAAGQAGDPDVANADEDRADRAAAPTPTDSASNRPSAASPSDQPNAPESQADGKQRSDTRHEDDAESVDGPLPDAAKGRSKQSGKKSTAAASNDAAAQSAANHKEAKNPEEKSHVKKAVSASQAAEQAGADVRSTSAEEQLAEELAASSQAREPRSAKTDKASAELRKAKAIAEKGVDPENLTGDPTGTAGTAGVAGKPSTEAAQISEETSGGVAAGDARPTSSLARRSTLHAGPRSANESRSADNEAGAEDVQDTARLAAETQPALSVTAGIDVPAKGGQAPEPASQPNQSNPTANVPFSERVLRRNETDASPRSDSSARTENSSSDAAERVQFVQRVARAFEAASDRGGAIRLRLHPPELGSLRVQLSVRNGAMTARVETETESARTMLLDNLPALKERLAEHQIKLERFDVDWQAQPQGNLPQGSGEHSRWQPPTANSLPGAVARSRNDPSAEAPARAPTRSNAQTSFDVVI